MIGLVRAELLRFGSRRLFRIAGLIVFAGILVAAISTFAQSTNDPETARARARAALAECQRSIEPEGPPGNEFVRCPAIADLQRELDRSFDFAETVPDASRGVAIVLFVLSFVLAASFMGAEWGTGSMTTLLTWEPRRGRVLAAKVLASAVILSLASAVTLAFLAAMLFPVASIRGSTAGLDGSVWWTLAGVWVRGAALAAFATLVASAIATITRNTAGAVGVAFVYGIILDPFLGFAWSGRFRPWLLQHLLPRLLGFTVGVPAPETVEEPGFPTIQATLSVTRPVVVLSIYAAVALAIAYGAFRARDVT